ncbi:MAG: hypothetical protein DMF88_03970 [Acidobacteria bacterium]|nr:MAG: hypothetical protein DMF88_03970 [Acidobacteriota bacterium]
MSAASAAVSETQSVTLPGAPDTSTVNALPGLTGAKGTVSVGPTLIVALVASFVQPPFANRRTLYVPGTVGATNCTVALVSPVVGAVVEPFRYFHPT